MAGAGRGSWWRWWRSREADGAGAADAGAAEPGGRRPIVRRGWRHTDLQFAGGVSQSRMRTFQPDHLLVDYTRTMLASLLLQPRPARIGMIGLGGGSQAKFCHRYLPEARIEVLEINPEVIALRRRFRIPDDDARLRVVLGDGAALLRERRRAYDLLLVDGYDETGVPEALSRQAFHDDCRDTLAPGGALASNLYATDVDTHMARLRRSFGRGRTLLIEEPRQSNRVAFAWRDAPLPDGPIDLAARTAPLPAPVRRHLGDVFAAFAAAWEARPGASR